MTNATDYTTDFTGTVHIVGDTRATVMNPVTKNISYSPTSVNSITSKSRAVHSTNPTFNFKYSIMKKGGKAKPKGKGGKC